MADRTLSFDIFAKDRASQAFQSAGRSSDSLGSSLKKVAGLAAGAFAAVGAASFAKGAVNAASDLNESMSKNVVVFGQANAEVLKFAKAADAIGLSDQAALAATGTFGNLFRAVGLSEKQSAKFSTSLTGLASDLASFNNTSIDDALEALRAGMVGETEPLKKFGVNMNEATLKAKALALGLSDGKKPLDANVKAQAAYALILDQTKLAQGDFARTSDGLANKQRIFAARMDDLKARIGQGLLPVLTKLTAFAADVFLPILGAIGQKLGVMASAFRAAFSGEGITSDGVVGMAERLGVTLRNVIDQAKLFWNALRTGFTEDEGTPIESIALTLRTKVLPVLKQVVAFVKTNLKPVLVGLGAVVLAVVVPPMVAWAVATVAAIAPFVALGAAVAGLVAGAIYAYTHFDKFREIVDKLREVAVSAFGAFRAVVQTTIKIAGAAWDRFGRGLVDNIGRAVGNVLDIVSGLLRSVSGVFDLIKAILTGKWGDAWDAVKEIAAGVWESIKGVVKLGIEGVRVIIETAMGTISGVWSTAWHAVATAFSDIWDGIKHVAKAAIDWIVDQIDEFLGPLDEWLARVVKILGTNGGGGVPQAVIDAANDAVARRTGTGATTTTTPPNGGPTRYGVESASPLVVVHAKDADAHAVGEVVNRTLGWKLSVSGAR